MNGYDINYEPRTATKSQALADFMADFTPTPPDDIEQEIMQIGKALNSGRWMMHTDGASNQIGVGLGVVLKSPHGG